MRFIGHFLRTLPLLKVPYKLPFDKIIFEWTYYNIIKISKNWILQFFLSTDKSREKSVSTKNRCQSVQLG